MELGTWGQLDSQKSSLLVLWVVRDFASDGCTSPRELIINYVAIKKVKFLNAFCSDNKLYILVFVKHSSYR